MTFVSAGPRQDPRPIVDVVRGDGEKMLVVLQRIRNARNDGETFDSSRKTGEEFCTGSVRAVELSTIAPEIWAL